MKNIIGILLTFVVGGLVGFAIGSPSIPSSDLSGDIGKVNRYKKQVVSEYSRVLLDKLKNDADFLAHTLSTLDEVSEYNDTYYAIFLLAEEAAKVNHFKNSSESLGAMVDDATASIEVLASSSENLRNAVANNNAAEVQEILDNATDANVYMWTQVAPALANFREEATEVLSAKQNVKDQELLSCALVATSSLGLYYSCCF